MVKLYTMLITNQKCRIWRFVRANHKGQPVFGEPKPEGCNIVTFRLEDIDTTLRADTSGSQGRAKIERAMIRVQLPANTTANMGAKFELVSLKGQGTYKVKELHPRFDAVGNLHHYQCDLEK